MFLPQAVKDMSFPCRPARETFCLTESGEDRESGDDRTAKRRRERRFANFIIIPIMKFFAALSYKKARVPPVFPFFAKKLARGVARGRVMCYNRM